MDGVNLEEEECENQEGSLTMLNAVLTSQLLKKLLERQERKSASQLLIDC